MNSLHDGGVFDPRWREREHCRIRTQVIREWRIAGRYDFTDAELNAEIDRRLVALQQKLSAAGQAQLPLMDVDQVSTQAKKDACKSSRQLRIVLRSRIVELLEVAGSDGLTREQMASVLNVKEGYVSSPVRYLIDHSEVACIVGTRQTKAGKEAGVVVLKKFLVGGQQ